MGVSNSVNLIALEIVDMTLYMQTAMMFVPAILGLLFMATLMFLVVKKQLPRRLPIIAKPIEESYIERNFHPIKKVKLTVESQKNRSLFMLKVLLFVLIIRLLLFVASYFSIPIWIVSVLGSTALLIWRWYHLQINPSDILKKIPWHILIFAFSMYV